MDIDFQNILDSPGNETIHQFDYFENIGFCHEESKTNKTNNTLFDHIHKTVRLDKTIRPEEINNSLRNTDLSEEISSTNIDTDIYNPENGCFIIQNELIQINSVAQKVAAKVNLNEDTKIDTEQNVSEASHLGTNFNIAKETLSYVEEFENIIKKVKNKDQKNDFINTNDIPSLTYTERKDLFNSINTKDDMDMLVDTTVYGNSKIRLPILTLRNFDGIVNKVKSGESRTTHNDHNYAMDLSHDNSKEFSIKSENENDQGKMIVDIITGTNELDLLNNADKDIIQETNLVLGNQSFSKKFTKQLDEMLPNNENNMGKNSETVNLHSSSRDEDKFPIKAADLKVCKIETISMENENNIEDSDCEGYNSSDFEFIDESEAYIEGIVTKSNKQANSFKFNRPEVISNKHKGHSSNYSRFFDRANSNHRYNLRRAFDSENERLSRSNHVIPQDEQYLELFAQPWTMYHYEVEHKSFHASKKMHVEVDNIGFNVGILQRLHEETKVDDVLEQEARENAKKILSMYPMQNRRCSRRF